MKSSRASLRGGILAVGVSALALVGAGCGGDSDGGSGSELAVVGYSTPEEVYTGAIQPAFEATPDGDMRRLVSLVKGQVSGHLQGTVGLLGLGQLDMTLPATFYQWRNKRATDTFGLQELSAAGVGGYTRPRGEASASFACPEMVEAMAASTSSTRWPATSRWTNVSEISGYRHKR